MANYFKDEQRIPSIFEVATAFDKVASYDYDSVKNKLDSYKKVYNKLTTKEKLLSLMHPLLAIEIKKNRDKALKDTMNFDGKEDGYGDAIRHCYWCALNQISAGLNSPLAKEFSDVHEDIPNNYAKAMDLHNNSVGYYLGNQAIINNWSENELLNQVIKAANNGKLYILK